MATWSLSPQYKKSAVEKMFFYKEGKLITIEQGFRWATFTVESDERPLTDEELKNEDGYELSFLDNDESWEMQDMIDGCWVDIEAGNDKTTEEDVEEFTELWEEDSFEAVENAGWSNDDTEYYYHGPLALSNNDTGEEFFGEPEQSPEVAAADLAKENAELAEKYKDVVANIPDDLPEPMSEEDLVKELEELKLEYEMLMADEDVVVEVTDWFPASINPAYKGQYEVYTLAEPNWPFPSRADWNGKKWDVEITQWRGLAKDPLL